MKTTAGMLLVTTALLMAACGTSTQDRALSGAGIGAGAGLIGGALTGHQLAGAVIGGAGGAAAGGLTSPNQIDLGKPIWER